MTPTAPRAAAKALVGIMTKAKGKAAKLDFAFASIWQAIDLLRSRGTYAGLKLSPHRVADSASNRASASANNCARRACDEKTGTATKPRASQHRAAADRERGNKSEHQPHKTFPREGNYQREPLTAGEWMARPQGGGLKPKRRCDRTGGGGFRIRWRISDRGSLKAHKRKA